MSEQVPEDERDSTFTKLFLQPENKVCFDCNSSNPKWASVNNAVFLCFQCAGKHRTFGVHISFIRSCGLDKWNRKQLKQMELGGNKAAKAYFEKHDLIQAGLHSYSLPLAIKYRTELAKKAESALQGTVLTPPTAPTATDTAESASIKESNEAKPKIDESPAAAPKLQPMVLTKKKESATIMSSTSSKY